MSVAKKTQAQQAYETIRRMIIRCELRPGELLNERALTEATGMGHTPVRDALQWLGHEGLVDIAPRRGTSVSQLNLDDVQQIFDLRVAMESVVADAALARLGPDQLAVFDELIAQVEAAEGESSDPEVDRRFHETLLAATGNRYLIAFYSNLHDASMRLFYMTRCDMEPRTAQLETLRRTRDALADRDGAALRSILGEHVRDFRRRVGGAISR